MLYMPSLFGENLFDDFFDMPFRAARPVRRQPDTFRAEVMKTDVKETEHGYELSISLPGVKKENIEAELKNGYLTVTATTAQDNDEKDENGHYIRRERYCGTASRSFYVGKEITQEDIRGSYTDGILTLNIPKKEEKKQLEEKKLITIEG